MINFILNGLFTDEYFIYLISSTMVEHSINKNNFGVRNKIKSEIHKILHSNGIYHHKIICDETNNNEQDKLIFNIDIQPTIISPIKKFNVIMQLYHWPVECVKFFDEEQYIKLYTQVELSWNTI